MHEIEKFSPSDLPNLDAPEAEKNHKWRMWIAKEIQQRALLGHYVLDGQISAVTGSPTAVRHAANTMALPTNEAAFQLETADEWIVSMQSEGRGESSFREMFVSLFDEDGIPRLPVIQHSKFTLLVTLEGLQSFITDCDPRGAYTVGVPKRHDIYKALVVLYELIMNNMELSYIDKQELLLRWHAICLDAVADTRNLCRDLCSQYTVKNTVFEGARDRRHPIDLSDWTRTIAARKALLHAVAIVDIVEQQPQGRSQPIHLPFSLFSAALIYAIHSITGAATVELPRAPDWKTVILASTDASTLPWSGSGSDLRHFILGMKGAEKGSWTSRNLLYEINSVRKLFRYISLQWGVAQEMKVMMDDWIALCT
jgi:hypothetical protein